jgi:hypothetical protein
MDGIAREIAATSPLAGRIVESYDRAVSDMRSWSALAADMARSVVRS